MMCCRQVYIGTPVTKEVIDEIRVVYIEIIGSLDDDDGLRESTAVHWSDQETSLMEDGPHAKNISVDAKISCQFRLDDTPQIQAILAKQGFLHYISPSKTFVRPLKKMTVQLN